jgi:hypothetical protein
MLSARPSPGRWEAAGRGHGLASFQDAQLFQRNEQRFATLWLPSTDIGLRRISPHHSRAIEVCTDLADRLLHHPDPSRPVVVIKREHDVFELAIRSYSDDLIDLLSTFSRR